MKRKQREISVIVAAIALLLLVQSAFAGGWVVITVDSLPGTVHAGEAVTLGFWVRQHGERPTNDVAPQLTAMNRETGETVTVDAEQAGETGHFEVSLVFPEAGTWEWQLSAAPFPQVLTFEPLTVLPAIGTDATAAEAVPDVVPQTAAPAVTNGAPTVLRWVGAGMLAVAALLVLVGQRRRQGQKAVASTPVA
jgi:hypothetical protein